MKLYAESSDSMAANRFKALVIEFFRSTIAYNVAKDTHNREITLQ